MAANADDSGAGDTEPIPTPQLSEHAIERFDERAPAGAVAPEAALHAAIPDDGIVSHPRFGQPEYPAPDRVWVYSDVVDGEVWTMAFVEDGGAPESAGSVVTCWRADEERYPHIRAYLIIRGFGGRFDKA